MTYLIEPVLIVLPTDKLFQLLLLNTKWFCFLLMICLHTMKWLQVLLFNTNNAIQYYSFIYKHTCGPKYCYVIPKIQFLNTTEGYQVFLFNIWN